MFNFPHLEATPGGPDWRSSSFISPHFPTLVSFLLIHFIVANSLVGMPSPHLQGSIPLMIWICAHTISQRLMHSWWAHQTSRSSSMKRKLWSSLGHPVSVPSSIMNSCWCSWRDSRCNVVVSWLLIFSQQCSILSYREWLQGGRERGDGGGRGLQSGVGGCKLEDI